MKREERKRVLRQEVEWCDEKDCFTRIAFETFYTKNRMLAVGIEASIRGGVYYGSGCISKSCVFMDTLTGILRWVDTKGAGDECSFKFQELIESFFKG